jgi:hypothetical protein
MGAFIGVLSISKSQFPCPPDVCARSSFGATLQIAAEFGGSRQTFTFVL